MANKNQLKNLLKKKGWTGEEVGKLLIASMLNDIKQQGQQNKEPLFSQSDFEQMESSLTSDRDYLTYGVYRDLYSSIIDSFNRGQGLYQQFFNGFSRLFAEFREVENADNAQKSIDNTPLIMTESQYKRLEAEAVKTLSGYKDSFCALMFHCLDNFLEADEAYIKEEAPAIWEALEATKKIPATGNRFLPLYNETYGEGYYSLPDGRRSDQMTGEEWQKTLELTINGETVQHYNQNRLIKSYELYFKGAKAIRAELLERTGKAPDLTDEELEEALEDTIGFNPNAEQIAEALDFSTPTEWHTYEEPPEGLTLYDLLELYPEEFRGAFEADEKEALKHFKKDAPALYDALKAYIESKVPQARGLKPNQLHKDIISWGELVTTGLIGCSELIQPDDRQIIDIATRGEDTTENKSKRLRTGLNGIAILKHPTPFQMDEQGDYIEQKSPLHFFQSLYTLEGDGEKIAELQGYIDTLINPALGYLYAFNTLMEIIGKVYDLPELAEVAHFDTTLFESKMRGFNGMLYIFYHDVYGNEAEKQHKRAIIKEAFRPLEAETLKPSQKAIEEITAELTKLGLSSEARKKLKYLDAFIDRLMNSGEGAL
jgi:hypothetical protein